MFAQPPAHPAVVSLPPEVLALYRAQGLFNLGEEARHARRYARAAGFYDAAITEMPGGAPAGTLYNNLGLVRLRAGDLAGAVAAYEIALAAKPTNHEVRFGAGAAFLQAGDLARGWPLFMSRHYTGRAPGLPNFPSPALVGLPAPGTRLLAFTDQGLGDELMFASLLPDLIAAGASITLVSSRRLVPLLQRSFPSVDVESGPVAAIAGRPFDAHIALADCARFLRPSFGSFPGTPYLAPDRPLAAVLRRRYRERAGGKPLVGISWRTSAPKVKAEKTAPLDLWGPLLTQPAAFVNLQYAALAADVDDARARFGADILADGRIDALQDLDTLAAQIAALDLVITTSSVTAHLAGGLGVPAIVLVPKGMGAVWAWFDGRADSPWYGSVRLARQDRAGGWTGAIDRAAALLAGFRDTGVL